MMEHNDSSQPPSDHIESNQTKQAEQNELLVFNNKCRVCLDTADIPIFGDELTPDISNDIETFGSIEIRNDDNLPKYICESCEKLLQAAVFFRRTAQQTNLQLKSQQYHEDCCTTNNTQDDAMKSEGFANEVSHANLETEHSSSIIKEEIIVEPFCIFNDFGTGDMLIEASNDEENNQDLSIVADRDDIDDLSLKYKHACKICDTHFKTAKAYSKHKKSAEHKKAKNSNKIKCEICFKYIGRLYYNRHMEAHSTDGKDDKLTCPICDKTFNKTYFNYHITHTHNKDNKKDSERIQCSVCNKSYEKHYYKFHLAIHNNDSSRYICDTCGKSFIQQSAFKRHSLIHGSELAFQCTLCPYKGRHAGLLKTHMQTHTRDYQHRCMECPARFLTKSNLNKHLQRHKGPVDFKCETCKKGFYSKPELERHFEVDHLGVKNHICNICGKAFGYRNAMMSHQLKVHKREKLTNGKGRLPLYLDANRNNDNFN